MQFSNKEKIFSDVIQLAEVRKKTIELSGDASVISKASNYAQSSAEKRAERSLNEYINSLSFDDVNMLKVVMYLGREFGQDEVELSPTEIYESYYKLIGESGWNKEIEVNQMTEKGPLGDYLKRGLEILKVEL